MFFTRSDSACFVTFECHEGLCFLVYYFDFIEFLSDWLFVDCKWVQAGFCSKFRFIWSDYSPENRTLTLIDVLKHFTTDMNTILITFQFSMYFIYLKLLHSLPQAFRKKFLEVDPEYLPRISFWIDSPTVAMGLRCQEV